MKLRNTISQLESENKLGLERAAILSKEEIEEARKLRELEKQKWEEFKEIIKDEQFMRYEHFQKLNLNQDILIHLSVKNTGKTTELYRLITACIGRGKKFIYGRVTPVELKTEIDKFETDENSPCSVIVSKGQYYFFLKSDIEQYREENPQKLSVRFSDLEKSGYQYVGKGMTFMGANTLGSGNYADFDTIFFDEIVPYTSKNYVNADVLYHWSVAVSTILRNKTELYIVMMGNLKATLKEVPILKYYGIDVSDNLRIVKRSMEGGEPCTILYVNSGSLYGNSIKSQASVAHHAPLSDRLFLSHNKIINSSTKVLTPEIVDHFQSAVAIALPFKQNNYIVEVRRHVEPKDVGKDIMEEDTLYAVKVHNIDITTNIESTVITNDLSISQQWEFITYMKNLPGFRFLYRLYRFKRLYYDSAYSLEMASNIINYHVKKIIKNA